MQFFWLANKCPHFVGAAVDEVASTDRTHELKLTVSLAENGTKQVSSAQRLAV
jgi:hypothetical protein